MKKIVDQELLRFIIVGLFNTFLGMVTMFGFYHLGMGYWGASGLSYFLCSIVSFFLNKHFTFKNEDSLAQTGLRFAVNIAVCYFAGGQTCGALAGVCQRAAADCPNRGPGGDAGRDVFFHGL